MKIKNDHWNRPPDPQKLSLMMNHASVSVTRTYLGITESQMLDTYDLLDF